MRLLLSFLFISLCNQAFSMMSDSMDIQQTSMIRPEQQTFLDSLETNPVTQNQKTTRRIIYLLARLIPKNKSEQQRDFITNQLQKPLVSSVEALFRLGEIDMNILYKLHQDDILTGLGQTLRAPNKETPESFTQLLKEDREAEKFWSLCKDHSVLSYPDFCSDTKYRFYRTLLAGQKEGEIVDFDDSTQINLDLGGVKMKDAVFAMLKCRHYFDDDIDFNHAFANFMPQEGTTSKSDSTNDQQNKRRAELVHNKPQAKRLPYSLNGNYHDDLQRALQASLEETNNLAVACNNFDTEHKEAIDRSFAEEASNLQSNQPPNNDGAKEKLINDILENPNFSPEDKNIFISGLFKSNNNEAIESTACASSTYTSETVPVDRTIPEKEMTPEERRIDELPSEPGAEELRNLRLRNLRLRNLERLGGKSTATNSNKSDSPNAFID